MRIAMVMAPMLEASHYDSVLDDCEPRPQPCIVCTGDDAPPCSEECHRLFMQTNCRRQETGYYMACRHALVWARLYAKESSTFADTRIAAIVDEINGYRTKIAGLRRLARGEES